MSTTATTAPLPTWTNAHTQETSSSESTPNISASPLVWTGDSATSGLFAPNGYLAVSPSVYTRLLPDIQTAYSLVDGPYERHPLVDHILGKEQQTCLLVPSSIQERDSTAEDDKSC